MSFATLEKAVLDEARDVLDNRKLRKADIQEWSTSPITATIDDEVVVFCPIIGVHVCVPKACDKRKATAKP